MVSLLLFPLGERAKKNIMASMSCYATMKVLGLALENINHSAREGNSGEDVRDMDMWFARVSRRLFIELLGHDNSAPRNVF